MNKLGAVIAVLALTVAVYMIMLVTMGVFTNLVESANATITASSNLTDYPGSQGFLVATPWIVWFVPAIISIAVIIGILKAP